MMDVGLKAWAELVREVYPTLPLLRDRTQWQAGEFERPSVYVETDIVSEKMHTPQSIRIIEDVGLVFHYDIERMEESEQGEPLPFDLDPFFLYIRQKRYCFASKRFSVMLVMEPPRTREKPDRMEVTLRYSYLLHVPKPDIQKIDTFDVSIPKEDEKG